MSELIQHTISAEIAEVASWLAKSGFPFDFHFDTPPPDHLLQAIIQEFARIDNESFGCIAWAVEMESGYVLETVQMMRKSIGDEQHGR